MTNRHLYHIVFSLLLLVTACTDADTNSETDAPRGQEVNSTDSERFPLSLTATEMQDDTVFYDGTRPTSWANAGVSDSIKMKLFIRRLQRWIDQNQVDSIAAHMNFPMNNPGIPDARDFKLNYSTYFSDGVKGALADQPLNQVFRNQQGVMIGQGQIWLRELNNNIQIFAINN
jgi:hypothetical protein